jgi:catechol 2,3-dioxygenase-like lactoylglutathione lyase family enzyme
MRRSLDFYLDVLGFTQTGYYPIESDPIRTEVRRDHVAIILYTEQIHDSDRPPAFTGALYVFPKSIEVLADELLGKVPFAWGPEDTDFGIREFAIRDPDGYTLVFAERADASEKQ